MVDSTEDLEREDPLFDKIVPVLVRYDDRENRNINLSVRVLLGTQVIFVGNFYLVIQMSKQQIHGGQRERLLHVEITDENDPFFLFAMDVNEADFHDLKQDQSLLVDFVTFPSKFIELLEKCLSETGGNTEGTNLTFR